MFFWICFAIIFLPISIFVPIKKIGKIFDVSVVDQPFYNSTDVVAVKGADNDDFLEKREELRKQHEEGLKQKEFEERKNQVLAKLG